MNPLANGQNKELNRKWDALRLLNNLFFLVHFNNFGMILASHFHLSQKKCVSIAKTHKLKNRLTHLKGKMHLASRKSSSQSD